MGELEQVLLLDLRDNFSKVMNSSGCGGDDDDDDSSEADEDAELCGADKSVQSSESVEFEDRSLEGDDSILLGRRI